MILSPLPTDAGAHAEYDGRAPPRDSESWRDAGSLVTALGSESWRNAGYAKYAGDRARDSGR